MNQEFIISAFTENHIGLLNRITIIFTRRKINIESLTVSESAHKGISKFTIVVNTTEDQCSKVTKQIEKLVEVLKAYYLKNEDMIYQEIALYKVSTEALTSGNQIESLVRQYNARILEVTPDYTVIEKTGHKEETQELFEGLNQYGVLQFIRSGRVAITRSPIEKLSQFLKDRDALLESIK
ncbi:MAG: acetolactate synthase small subunit [Bacteroidota bacterium]|nr:acetolactate synthase small subunit [Bacteroidota bacterium]